MSLIFSLLSSLFILCTEMPGETQIKSCAENFIDLSVWLLVSHRAFELGLFKFYCFYPSCVKEDNRYVIFIGLFTKIHIDDFRQNCHHMLVTFTFRLRPKVFKTQVILNLEIISFHWINFVNDTRYKSLHRRKSFL